MKKSKAITPQQHMTDRVNRALAFNVLIKKFTGDK